MRLTTLLFTLAMVATLQAYSASSDKPNIVLVITDDQGYGDLACHGNPWIKTPNIDQLYTESTRLTNFHVSPTCSPTRSAVMTGHYNNRTGVWHTISGRSMLRDNEITIAQVLSDNGYATGIFGKWHLGDNYPFRPEDNGFQEVVCHLGGGVGQQHDYWNNDYFNDVYVHNGKQERYEGYCTDVWFEEATRYIDEKAEEGKPFFAYIATNAPHGPYYVDNKYVEPYKDNKNIPNPIFYGMIANADENIGKLQKHLDEKGLADNTIFIFMTDNGTAGGVKMNWKTKEVTGGYNAGMKGKKASEYEGGHRVPFFIKWPNGNLPKGKDIDYLTAHVDMMPTLLEMVGIDYKSPVPYDGTSIIDAITKGKQKKLEDRILVVDNQRKEIPLKYKQCATMQGPWRMVNNKALYNVSDDPGQKLDIKDKYPKKFKELQQAYEQTWADLEPTFANTPHFPLCHEDEPVTLLRAHDVHLDEKDGHKSVPWNAEKMRAGFKTYGYYAVEVLESGKYKFELLRWPPEVEAPLTAGLPIKPAVPGTTVVAFKEGVALPIKTAGVIIDGLDVSTDIDPNAKAAVMEVELKKGKHQLRTWFAEEDGKRYAAFYARITKL
ncbi:arylsulfatase [Reichenbachiella versicolor]|uniref:arylsulfatase n=1 Tax=Reichenbachiella versicolor TaxID=1821036 RepID=UPI000D6E0E84|nr:arylsulfatase [Reichenbachiella versicolor]